MGWGGIILQNVSKFIVNSLNEKICSSFIVQISEKQNEFSVRTSRGTNVISIARRGAQFIKHMVYGSGFNRWFNWNTFFVRSLKCIIVFRISMPTNYFSTASFPHNIPASALVSVFDIGQRCVISRNGRRCLDLKKMARLLIWNELIISRSAVRSCLSY